MQRYAAICSGIIKIPGVLGKLIEIYNIPLKWYDDHGHIGILRVLEYIMVWDITIFSIFLWIYQQFNILVECIGFLSFEEEQLDFQPLRCPAICSDMQRYAAICSGIIGILGVLDKLMEVYDASLKYQNIYRLIEILRTLEYLMVSDISTSQIFLWIYQHSNMFSGIPWIPIISAEMVQRWCRDDAEMMQRWCRDDAEMVQIWSRGGAENMQRWCRDDVLDELIEIYDIPRKR